MLWFFCLSAHRPRSPRQNSLGGASPGGSSLPSPQTGTAPVENATTPTSAPSPTAASPAPNMVTSPSGDGRLSVTLCIHQSIKLLRVLVWQTSRFFNCIFFALFFCAVKECHVQETRQTSPTANKENIKPLDSSPSINRPICKGKVYLLNIWCECFFVSNVCFPHFPITTGINIAALHSQDLQWHQTTESK